MIRRSLFGMIAAAFAARFAPKPTWPQVGDQHPMMDCIWNGKRWERMDIAAINAEWQRWAKESRLHQQYRTGKLNTSFAWYPSDCRTMRIKHSDGSVEEVTINGQA